MQSEFEGFSHSPSLTFHRDSALWKTQTKIQLIKLHFNGDMSTPMYYQHVEFCMFGE